MTTVHLPAIPFPLSWHKKPAGWEITPAGDLIVHTHPVSDWFIDPGGRVTAGNAAALLFSAPTPDQLSAYITVDFSGKYDAGVLVAYQGPRSWAKLCLELSPYGQLMVVSVITKGVSDDCNSYLVEGKSHYMRLSRLGQAYAFHASYDGQDWFLVRHFALDAKAETRIGFLAQSPTGSGCQVQFSQIQYKPGFLLEDIRSRK